MDFLPPFPVLVGLAAVALAVLVVVLGAALGVSAAQDDHYGDR